MTSTTEKTAPAGPGRLSAAQSTEVLDRLLDAAMKLFFSDAGFAGTTMERIAREAGASTKTIYSRFSDKGEILQAVVRRTLERVTRAREAESMMDPATTEPRAFLMSIGGYVNRATLSSLGAGLNRLAFGEAQRHPVLVSTYCEAMEYSRVHIRKALDIWHEKGLLPRVGDTEVASRVCHSMMTDRSRVWTALGIQSTEKEWDTYLALAVDTFLTGCGYQDAPPKAIKTPSRKKRPG